MTDVTTPEDDFAGDYDELVCDDPDCDCHDDEDDLDVDPIVRAKWTIEGATTLEEAAQMSEAFAGFLRAQKDEGWELRYPVEDDYGFLTWTGDPDKRPDPYAPSSS